MADSRSIGGGVVTAIGVALVALALFADDLPFAPDNLFLPIMLIFFGRAISRHQRRERAERRPPVVVTEEPPRSRPVPKAEPAPRTLPATPAPREAPSTSLPVDEDEPVAHPDVVIPAPRPIPTAHPRVPTHGVKSSEDMIAEAKERLRRKPG